MHASPVSTSLPSQLNNEKHIDISKTDVSLINNNQKNIHDSNDGYEDIVLQKQVVSNDDTNRDDNIFDEIEIYPPNPYKV